MRLSDQSIYCDLAIVKVQITYEEEYVVNSGGKKLFTCRWVPVNREPKALIFLCHGYAMETSISMKGTGTLLAKAGYAVHGVDYQGHGKSYGLLGYVESFDAIIDDCSDYFSQICELKENRSMMRFLLGESMGGAVALRLHRKKPDYWDGVILIAPMCKIADDMRPNPMVVSVLTKLCNYIPTWRLIPTQDIIDVAFRRPEIREEIRNNPYCYKQRRNQGRGQPGPGPLLQKKREKGDSYRCAFTNLRMNPDLFQPDNWRRFVAFLKQMKEGDSRRCRNRWREKRSTLSM